MAKSDKRQVIRLNQTFHIKAEDKIQGDYLRWGNYPLGKTLLIPGYYDVIQVERNKVLLAENLSDNGERLQPSSKYQYWVTKKALSR